jgi:hypothetical protein
LFDTMADGIRQAGGFGEPEQYRFDWERTYARDEWLAILATRSAVTKLAPDERADAVAAVSDLIDAMGGSFSMGYTTVAVTAIRTQTA